MSRFFTLTTAALCAAMACLPAGAEYSDETDGSYASCCKNGRAEFGTPHFYSLLFVFRVCPFVIAFATDQVKFLHCVEFRSPE